jgi:hypothetical protein
MERALTFLDSIGSELTENEIKAAVTFEQECSMLKSSTNGRFLSVQDSGLEIEIPGLTGRLAIFIEIRLV